MLYLCVATPSLLVLGLLYAWSIFAVPLGAQFNWDRSALSQVYSVSMIAFCLGSLTGSQIARVFSVRLTIVCAAVLLATGFAATATLASWGIGVLYLFYGVLGGFGCGIGYNTIVSTVNLWFPDRPGLSAGVLMMGFGLGSLILGTPASVAMAQFGWAPVFYIIAAVGAFVMLVLAFLITMPPVGITELAPRDRAKAATVDDTERPPNALKTPYFYLYCIWGTIMIALNTTIMGDARAGAETVGVDPTIATLLVGLMSLISGISRVVVGAIYDRTNLKTAMLLSTGVGLVTASGLAIAFAFKVPELYLVAAIVLGFTFGSVPVIASAFVRQAYPARDFPRNLATANLNIATGAVVSALIINIGRTLGGDRAIYATLAVLVLIALVDVFVFTKRLPRS